MSKKQTAFLLAATHSGAGKTTLTLGLLAALVKKNFTVQPFKCGPDFIDPTLHQLVTGKISRNLDLRMCGHSFVSRCFTKNFQDADIAVIEGVMGLFDGGRGSGAALAKTLNLPIILVVDAKACAESIAAVVKGFETLDPELTIAGVILNRVGSDKHLSLLSNSINQHCQSVIFGALPRDPDFSIPDRHLGLFMGDEDPLSQKQVAKLSRSVEENIDLDLLLETCSNLYAQPLANDDKTNFSDYSSNVSAAVKTRIGIAKDRAFSFYYQDNLDMLEESGAELVSFSPLDDSELPKEITGLYFGGGYPELYAKELSQNQSMLAAVSSWIDQEKPVYAECGGFIYLTEGITDQKSTFWPLVGTFPVKAKMQDRLSQLGYREVTTTDSVLFGSGPLYGHEFHYSLIDEMPDNIERVFKLEDGRTEGYQFKNTLAGYIHLHFGRTRQATENFISFCEQKGRS